MKGIEREKGAQSKILAKYPKPRNKAQRKVDYKNYAKNVGIIGKLAYPKKKREEINICDPLLMLYYIFIKLTKFSINHFWTKDLTSFMKFRFFMHF